MNKIKTLADLKKLQSEVQSKINLREKGDIPESLVQIKVSMATCGIASGAKETMSLSMNSTIRELTPWLPKPGVWAIVMLNQPLTPLPGKEPIVYGFVNKTKASEIIEKHIKLNELVDGIIPVNYSSIDN